MRAGRWLAVLAAAAFGAACGDGVQERMLSPTGPRLLVGTTVSVVVSCPAQMEVYTSGSCAAFGYDSNGTFTNSNVTSWSTSTPTFVSVSSSGGVSALAVGTGWVTAVIDGVAGSTSIAVVRPPDPISVSISGPSQVPPNRTCEWIAGVSGGTAPYTYSWSQTTGSGSGWDDIYYGSSSSSFTLSVTVTDAAGRTASASKSVSVSTKALPCPL